MHSFTFFHPLHRQRVTVDSHHDVAEAAAADINRFLDTYCTESWLLPRCTPEQLRRHPLPAGEAAR